MFKIPKGYNTVTKTFRLPEKLVEELAKVSQTNNISMNKLVKECLIYALENLEKPTDKNDSKQE